MVSKCLILGLRAVRVTIGGSGISCLAGVEQLGEGERCIGDGYGFQCNILFDFIHLHY